MLPPFQRKPEHLIVVLLPQNGYCFLIVTSVLLTLVNSLIITYFYYLYNNISLKKFLR